MGTIASVFVTFEGPEGAGKTTLIRGLSERLESIGRKSLLTREPGAGEVGRRVREILLHGEDLDPKAELFLFLADRSHHVSRLIRPALSEGKVVLCDRFADSTVVYQGYGRGLDVEVLREWNRFATDSLRPDRTYLLDLLVDVGLARVQDKDRMDAQPIEFHERVRQGFLTEAKREPDRWLVVDASKGADEVLEAVWRDLSARLQA